MMNLIWTLRVLPFTFQYKVTIEPTVDIHDLYNKNNNRSNDKLRLGLPLTEG